MNFLQEKVATQRKGLRCRATRAHTTTRKINTSGKAKPARPPIGPMTPAQLARHDQDILVRDHGRIGSNGCSPCEPADQTPDVEELGCTLPPLPAPDLSTMRSEASGGISLVFCLVVTFVGLTIAFSSSGTTGMSELRLTIISIICTEAVVALGSLFMLMNGDPGVIRRTRDTAIPVPPEVVEKLQSADEASGQPHPLVGMSNIEENGRTYCVRCCLWRDKFVKPDRMGRMLGRREPARARVHHCSTCQRCVRQFDHHCGVFGRCIAGRVLTWEGNMPYFVLMIACGYAGFITTAAAGVMAISGAFGTFAG